MQNLPDHLRQKDKAAYEAITLGGSKHYETLYMSGRATREDKPGYMGIPADDFNIFATMVYALADHSATFSASPVPIRHIDAGTGPNLYVFIASLPYADELISIDIAPANVARLKAIADGKVRLPKYWQSWLEIAVILFDIGNARNLAMLDKERPELYDALRHWPTMTRPRKDVVRAAVYRHVQRSGRQDNPYRGLDLQALLSQKLQPQRGDVLDGVEMLHALERSADIYTRVFFSESIDNSLEVVLHAETNGIQFAKEGALSISGHMSKTMGYKGLYTPGELAADSSKILVELPATPGFFEVVLGGLMELTDDYRVLWAGLGDSPEERKMVRQGLLYGGAVILCGKARYLKDDGSLKYTSGMALLASHAGSLRTVTIDGQSFNCARWEVGRLVDELAGSLENTDGISLDIKAPGLSGNI